MMPLLNGEMSTNNLIILDHLDEHDLEIMRVLMTSSSSGFSSEGIKSCGDNLESIEFVAHRLNKLADLGVIVEVAKSQFRLQYANGESLFWGKGELWNKILNLLYVKPLEYEKLFLLTRRSETEFTSAIDLLRSKQFVHRIDSKQGDREVHIWEITPIGKEYARNAFSSTSAKEMIDLRGLIIKTEEELRDLVSSVLTREYGTSWENDPNKGWSKRVSESLVHRMEDTKKDFPTKNVSTRLIDYCYVLNLKDVIKKNEEIFKLIFQDWDRLMVYFDDLGKYRDPIMHHTSPLSESEINLCVGICGEFRKIVEHWKRGFSRKIMKYACNINFDVEEQGENIEEQKKTALQLAERCIDRIKQLAIEQIKTEKIEHGDSQVIKLKEGLVRITFPHITRQYNGKYAQTARIYIESENFNAFSKVLNESNHTYWHIEWTISDSLDVNSLISKVQETTGKTPSSKSGTGAQPNVHWTSADYTINATNGQRIRVVLSSIDLTKSKIGITHDDSMFDKGFRKAHQVFSPDITLSIIYGEVPLTKVRELVNQSVL